MLLVASLVLLSLMASSIDAASMRAGHRCCVADQWHGDIAFSLVTVPDGGSTVTLNQAGGQIDADWNMKRQRFILTGIIKPGDYIYNVTVYQDFAMKKQYNVLENGTCTSEDLFIELFPPCIPANFTYGGRTTLGSGTESLHEDLWSGPFGNMEYTMSVTVNDCTPVTMSLIGSDGKGTNLSDDFLYSNVVQESLRSPDAVVIPTKCLKSQGGMVIGK